jgi:hypothetical protein
MDKPHILAEVTENGFCYSKSKCPLKLKIKYQWFPAKEDLLIDTTLDALLVFAGQYL